MATGEAPLNAEQGAPGRRRNRRPDGVQLITTLAVLGVTSAAARGSFGHMRSLAESVGEDPAWLLPVSVDGLAVAASMTMLVRRRAGQPAGLLAWSSLLLALGVSLAANVASAEPTLTGRLVAAWPPLGLLLSYELLMQQIKAPTRRPAPATAPPAAQVATSVPGDAPAVSPGRGAGQPGDDASARRRRAPAPPTARPRAATGGTATGTAGGNRAERQAAAAVWLASVAGGGALTGAELGERYGRSARWGRDVIAEARETAGEQEVAAAPPVAGRNGQSPGGAARAAGETAPATDTGRGEVGQSGGTGVAGKDGDGKDGDGRTPGNRAPAGGVLEVTR